MTTPEPLSPSFSTIQFSMKLYCRKTGESGSNIVILHGIFGSSDNWLTIGKVLAEQHTVYMLDQRNHGQSPRSDVFNYEVMAADLKEFLEENAIENPILVGHSMGGKVVMQFVRIIQMLLLKWW